MLLNNDITVEPDFHQQLLDFMEANPEAGAVQPKIYFELEILMFWNGSNGFINDFRHTLVREYKKKP